MTDTIASARPLARAQSRYFYFYMAIACAAVAFIGFLPTYWVPMASGTLQRAPVYHLHGLLFFSWTIYFIYQTWLGASGRVARHRDVGLLGVSLATAMVVFGVTVAITSVKRDTAAGMGEAARAFMIVPLSDIVFFASLILLALLNLRRTETHKRLMLLATISLLAAPIARWFLTFLAPPGAADAVPPVAIATGPVLVSMLLLIVAIVHDWRSRGRPHPVYLWGGAALLGMAFLRAPLSVTPAWLAIAAAITGLAG
jgi:hypothetical protein